MGLLTAPFPSNNPTSLSSLVLEGLGQLKSELNARQKISQDEQENWLQQGKQAASNILMMQNTLAGDRDFQAKQEQNQFSNYLGLSHLGIEQANSKSTIEDRKASTDSLVAERAAHADYWKNGGAKKAGTTYDEAGILAALGGDPASANQGNYLTTQPSDASAPGVNVGTQDPPPADMANPSAVGAPQGGPATVRAGNALLPSPGSPQTPTLMQQPTQVAPAAAAKAQIAAQAKPKIDEATDALSKMQSQFKDTYGRTPDETLNFSPSEDDSKDPPTANEVENAKKVQQFSSGLDAVKNRLVPGSAPAPKLTVEQMVAKAADLKGKIEAYKALPIGARGLPSVAEQHIKNISELEVLGQNPDFKKAINTSAPDGMVQYETTIKNKDGSESKFFDPAATAAREKAMHIEHQVPDGVVTMDSDGKAKGLVRSQVHTNSNGTVSVTYKEPVDAPAVERKALREIESGNPKDETTNPFTDDNKGKAFKAKYGRDMKNTAGDWKLAYQAAQEQVANKIQARLADFQRNGWYVPTEFQHYLGPLPSDAPPPESPGAPPVAPGAPPVAPVIPASKYYKK